MSNPKVENTKRKKGKVFVQLDQMLQIADQVNAAQEAKIKVLQERDIEYVQHLIKKESLSKTRAKSKNESKSEKLNRIKDRLRKRPSKGDKHPVKASGKKSVSFKEN